MMHLFPSTDTHVNCAKALFEPQRECLFLKQVNTNISLRGEFILHPDSLIEIREDLF